MKTVLKKVYYCDFCKKRRLSAAAMKLHESHCTANPNRVCRMEHEDKIDLPKIIEKYKKQTKTEKIQEPYGMTLRVIAQPKLEDIQKDVNYCPMCTLAVLRCVGLTDMCFGIQFDYKKAVADWWKDRQVEVDYSGIY